MLECITTLTVAATATEHAALGTCVLQLPLRRPAAVAKQAAALQALSGGRFVLGLGVGSHAREYEMAGADFAERGRRLDEGIGALRRAWRSAGEAGLAYRQEPAVPDIPLWIGGSSPAALARAAGADGWIPMFVPPDEYAAGLARLGELAESGGRSAAEITPAVVVMANVGGDAALARRRGTEWLSALYGIPAKAFERHLVAGPASACAEVLRRFLDAGAEHVAVMIADDHALDHFAALVAAMDPVPAGQATG